jgi:DNA-3-methyladenine glycosylase
MILPNSFYQRPVVEVAIELLGKTLITNIGGLFTESIIVETEAYEYPNDKGSHTYNHRRTPKNESMYLLGGHIYVYKCYGVHDMLNIVTEDQDIGSAVLIRAVEPVSGIETMFTRRGSHKLDHTLTGGPGKVCQALGISQKYDGMKLGDQNDEVMIISQDLNEQLYCVSPRVGMSSKVGECSNWSYRFYLKSRFVSRPLSVFYDWN